MVKPGNQNMVNLRNSKDKTSLMICCRGVQPNNIFLRCTIVGLNILNCSKPLSDLLKHKDKKNQAHQFPRMTLIPFDVLRSEKVRRECWTWLLLQCTFSWLQEVFQLQNSMHGAQHSTTTWMYGKHAVVSIEKMWWLGSLDSPNGHKLDDQHASSFRSALQASRTLYSISFQRAKIQETRSVCHRKKGWYHLSVCIYLNNPRLP